MRIIEVNACIKKLGSIMTSLSRKCCMVEQWEGWRRAVSMVSGRTGFYDNKGSNNVADFERMKKFSISLDDDQEISENILKMQLTTK